MNIRSTGSADSDAPEVALLISISANFEKVEDNMKNSNSKKMTSMSGVIDIGRLTKGSVLRMFSVQNLGPA